MVRINLNLVLIVLTFLCILSTVLTETPAKCKARCFHENEKCCLDLPQECGTTCYEAARNCYSSCNHLAFLYSLE